VFRCLIFMDRQGIWSGADWPYNEVGKIPRGPSSLGAPELDLWKFPVWAAAIAL
jgi:hypothetical protein